MMKTTLMMVLLPAATVHEKPNIVFLFADVLDAGGHGAGGAQ